MSCDGHRLRLTVLIPTYGRPGDLRRCLEGLLRLERLPDETVVVVHETDAATQDLLEELGVEGARLGLRPLITGRLGQIPQMNEGLRAVTGDVVCFTDDDCVPRPDWLTRLEEPYADPRVGGVGGRDVVHHGEQVSAVPVRVVGRLTTCGRIVGHHHDMFAGEAVRVDHLKGANMSFRRELLPAFDEALVGGSCALNDTDASLSVRDAGYVLVYDPRAVVDHFPAVRFGESTRRLGEPRLVFSDAHNWAYCMFKHLSPLRKALFVLYALLVGSGNRLGLVKYLLTGWRRPRSASAQLGASWRGIMAGIRSYRRRRPAQVDTRS